jgi:hypothetical protein
MVLARPPFLFPPGLCDLPPAHSPPPLLGRLPLPRPSHRPPSPPGLGLRPAQPPPPSPLTTVWAPPVFFLLEKPRAQPPAPPRARARTAPASPPLLETASRPPLHSPLAPTFPLPKTEGVKAINGALHRRSIPLPVRPPRSPLRPYKRVRSSPLLTALLLAPISHSPCP